MSAPKFTGETWHVVNRYSHKTGAGRQGIAWTITRAPAVWSDGGLVSVDGRSDVDCIADTRDVRNVGIANVLAAAPRTCAALDGLAAACEVFRRDRDVIGFLHALEGFHGDGGWLAEARAALAKARGEG